MTRDVKIGTLNCMMLEYVHDSRIHARAVMMFNACADDVVIQSIQYPHPARVVSQLEVVSPSLTLVVRYIQRVKFVSNCCQSPHLIGEPNSNRRKLKLSSNWNSNSSWDWGMTGHCGLHLFLIDWGELNVWVMKAVVSPSHWYVYSD